MCANVLPCVKALQHVCVLTAPVSVCACVCVMARYPHLNICANPVLLDGPEAKVRSWVSSFSLEQQIPNRALTAPAPVFTLLPRSLAGLWLDEQRECREVALCCVLASISGSLEGSSSVPF